MIDVVSKINKYQNCYNFSDALKIDDLIRELEKKFTCTIEPDREFKITYYDTFDWRLYAREEVLVLEKYPQKQKIFLEKLSDGAVKAIAPWFIDEENISDLNILPPALHKLIAPTIAMRALLPVVHVEGYKKNMLLRNKNEKIVVRLSVEKNSVAVDKKDSKENLPCRIIIHPIKGYNKELKIIRGILNSNTSLTPCGRNQYDMALKSIGRRAGEYSSKVKTKLKPDARSLQAVKCILQQLMSVMVINEPGMIARLDTEFLHDYRVAVRRSRSILSQMKDVLPGDRYGFFKKEFTWLGDITTPARDLDVYLLNFENYQNSLIPEMRDALLPFREYLQQQQKIAYKELIKAIKSARYKKLKKSLDEFLKDKNEVDSHAPNSKKNIHGQANTRIWRCYRRVRREADGLSHDSPAEEFHELRKSCKKLRYLMEFFQDFYPEKNIAQLIQQLKILQENLGEFQDMDVQSIALRTFAQKMAEQGVKDANTFMAMGMLADSMEQKKIQLKYEFEDCYKNFTRKKYLKLFKDLFETRISPDKELADESIG